MPPARLQAELKKKHAFDSLEQEATLNILRTSDQIQNRLGRLLREYGLTPSQYNVLRILRGEGHPLPCQDIVERMIQVVPAMTGLLDRLEKQELISRERSRTDRRVIYVSLTPSGKAVLSRLDRPIHALHHQLLGHLSPGELQQLSQLLEKARERV